MNSTGESPGPPKSSSGRAAEGNCVAVRRGGEQPEADLQSQTQVNSIRPTVVASLLANGEAYARRDNRTRLHRSNKGGVRATEGGWSENAGKGSYVSGESCRAQDCEEADPAAVRAAIGAKKPGNAGGAKGGRKANASSARLGEENPPIVPATDKQGGEDRWQSHRAERGVWSEKMLKALERGVKGNKWFSLIDKVYADRTLELAWEKVRTNAGACGVDGIDIRRFGKDSPKRLLGVKEQLRGRRYEPKPVKRVWIPKPGSKEKRPLGIPVVTDRVVQTALRMVIEPIFEKTFAAHSYGYRPGRCCHDALGRVEQKLLSGQVHVVDIDIEGYFAAIPHEALMEKVEREIADGEVLKLIRAFLQASVLDELREVQATSGTPQGGVISPLMANIYLNDLDWLMERSGYAITRYADDMVVLCKSAEEAKEVLVQIQRWMDGAALRVHPQKTRIIDMREVGAHFEFLGYRFQRSKRGRINRLVRPKSEHKLKARLRKLTKRANGHSLPCRIHQINPILQGWYGYFKQANRYQLADLDAWMRQRLRAILRKRRGGRGHSRGKDYQRWPNSYFAALGLYSLEEAKERELVSLQKE